MLKVILKRWVLRACLNEGNVLDDTWATVHNKEQKTENREKLMQFSGPNSGGKRAEECGEYK